MLALIIFGRKSITGSKGRGEFTCPKCQSKQPYDHKHVRRWFTLYFIPVFPVATVGEYVECGGCQGTFKPIVLEARALPPPA